MESIRVSKDAFAAFDKELELAVACPTRTLKDIENKDVLTILENPNKKIEIVDPSTDKVIGTVKVGAGIAGIACTSAFLANGAVATAISGGGALFTVGAVSAVSIPVIGWIIATIIAVVAVIWAWLSKSDKEKVEQSCYEKEILYQEKLRKLAEELEKRRNESKENKERIDYIKKILKWNSSPNVRIVIG